MIPVVYANPAGWFVGESRRMVRWWCRPIERPWCNVRQAHDFFGGLAAAFPETQLVTSGKH
jgi:hypothetical protein